MKMVLADRNAENARRDINGRARSRNTSPNGHHQTDSSDDDSNGKKNGTSSKSKAKSEYEAEKIRVGRDYQVVCPDLIPEPSRNPETLNDRALLVWSPTKDIPETKLEEYIAVAKEKYGYNGEQALGMLFWHKHDLERAVLDLANFTPFPDEWTVEDKVLFEQAFQFHGKSFHRIRQMLPDKSIASLVKYYYSWKKTRSRTSVMDRQEKAKKNEGSENGSDHGSNEESDNEEKKWPMHRGIRRCSNSPPRGGVANDDFNSSAGPTNQPSSNAAPSTAANTVNASIATSANGGKEQDSKTPTVPSNNNNSQNNNVSTISGNKSLLQSTGGGVQSSSIIYNCTGCGVACNEINNIPEGQLCNSCHHHWRRTGVLRPTCGPNLQGKRKASSSLFGNAGERHKRRPPRGMYINHDDIVALASSAQTQIVPPAIITPTATALNAKSNVVKSANDDLLASMEREIVSLLTQIQSNKQKVSTFIRKNSESLDDLRAQDNNSRIISRWNNEELLLAVAGVRKFGKDFQAIAETLTTKTDVQVRTFFVNYRRKYNLDSVLKEYEQEAALKQKQQQRQKAATVVGATETATIGEADTNKEPKITSTDSTNGVHEENQNLSIDDDVMEVDNPVVYDINNVMKSNHKRLSASINIKEKLKDLDEVSIAIIPQPAAPANPTPAVTSSTTATSEVEPMDTSESADGTTALTTITTTTATTTTTTAAVTATPISKEILQENINSASNNIVAK